MLLMRDVRRVSIRSSLDFGHDAVGWRQSAVALVPGQVSTVFSATERDSVVVFQYGRSCVPRAVEESVDLRVGVDVHRARTSFLGDRNTNKLRLAVGRCGFATHV